jgi:hypothetical protein
MKDFSMRQQVNYILHHKNVNIKIINSDLNSTHISLYNALFLIWNECGFDTELSVNRNDVMKLSKIGSANTYTKCLKELDSKGFIKYNPSYNPLIGSKINLYRFDKGSDNSSVKGSSKGTDKGSDKGSDTLYKLNKLLNKETIKLINSNPEVLNENLSLWINSIDVEIKKNENIIYPYETEKFYKAWELWKRYKKEQHNFKYKGDTSEQAALKKIGELSSGSEITAITIIEQSISNSWSGLFQIKNNNNGTGQNKQKGFIAYAQENGIFK